MEVYDLTKEEWAESASDFHDLDVGSMVAIGGVLHNGDQGIVIMTRTARGWTQRGRFTTSHLNCDYVGFERLDKILELWVPVDFRTADALRIRPDQVADVWHPQVEGEIPNGLSHIG
tara:strand:- start:4736 stop:5086 length:351 start_codon:yes stop_codon:yes gene_type:complete